MNEQFQTMNQSHQQMMNRSYSVWQQQALPLHPPPLEVPLKFKNQQQRRSTWKGKKGCGGGGGGCYASVQELQPKNPKNQNNPLKVRRFDQKKKFNRSAPFAPRNTTSYIIRAKKSGGIASLVSPCPVTPAILPTPFFSPSREFVVDTAKEEWGVDGYGSMKGLIRLRSPGHGHEIRYDGDEDVVVEEGSGSSESEVEEHVEVERRLDHDLSRFEMIYPNYSERHSNNIENRVDDQDSHIAQLEEENMFLKERLFLMESDVADLRMRLQLLENGRNAHGSVENNDESSDIEGGDGGDVCSAKSVGDGGDGCSAKSVGDVE